MENYEQYLIDITFEYLDKHFTPKQVETILAQKPLTGPGGIRQQLGQIDYEYFARAYLPDYCNLPPCQFHHEQYAEMRWIEDHGGGIKEIIAAPRESAKSTLWNTIYVANNVLYAKKHYIVIVSDSSDQAEDDLKKVKEAIEDNEYILEDFGALKGKTTWKTDAILTKNDVMVIARGSGKKIRGIKHKQYRPDLIVLDDIENDENVMSPDQRKKLMNWFTKVVTKAGSIDTDIVVIGTILHYDSLLNNLLGKPGYRRKKYKAVIKDSDSPLWEDWTKLYTDLAKAQKTDPITGETLNVKEAREFYEAHKEEMNAGVELIWPEAKGIYFYKEALVNEGQAAYNSEFQNEPIDPFSSWITPDDFHYYEDLPPLTVVKGALDPSLGEGEESDPSAFCSVGKDENGYMYVIESDAKRRSPDQQITDLFIKHSIFDYLEFYIEDVAFQAYLASNVQKESAKNGTYINIVTEPKPKGKKHPRIKAQLEPLIKNGYLRFHKSQQALIEGLIYLGSLKHDDEPDALQMVCALFAAPQESFVHSMMPDICGVSVNW